MTDQQGLWRAWSIFDYDLPVHLRRSLPLHCFVGLCTFAQSRRHVLARSDAELLLRHSDPIPVNCIHSRTEGLWFLERAGTLSTQQHLARGVREDASEAEVESDGLEMEKWFLETCLLVILGCSLIRPRNSLISQTVQARRRKIRIFSMRSHTAAAAMLLICRQKKLAYPSQTQAFPDCSQTDRYI